MGAGKSAVGRLLAKALGWRFVDVDALIESNERRSIADIFREAGEPYFREIEARTVAMLVREKDVVLAPGGGWGAVPGRLKELPETVLSVWLRVSPEEAWTRSRSQEVERPLLEVLDPVQAARELLERRSPFYAEANVEVDTEGRTPEDVAASILALLRK
jgi:shikimate kinase